MDDDEDVLFDPLDEGEEEEEDEDDEYFEEEDEMTESGLAAYMPPLTPLRDMPIELKGDQRKSSAVLTDIEKAKVIGMRADDLDRGEPPYLSFDEVARLRGINNSIAVREFELNLLDDYKIRREFPGTREYEIYRVGDLIKPR